MKAQIYEKKLKVVMLISRYKERTHYTLEQFKKRDDAFKLVIIERPGFFALGDIVTLRIGTDLDAVETVQ